MRELELSVQKGFAKNNLAAQERILHSLESSFADKVKRRLGIDDEDLQTLRINPERLKLTINEVELTQLLLGTLKPGKNTWNLGRLNELVVKIEDWGQ